MANCSTAAQFFHLVRRQGTAEIKRPLIVMTPKSFLRDKRAATPVVELTQGRFREVVADDTVAPEAVERLVLCSGKFGHELITARDEADAKTVAVTRVEQLYPFPCDALNAEFERYTNLKEVVWAQEEPRNMGAWSFVLQRFHDLGRAVQYVGRPESSSPATGSFRRHKAEQEFILKASIGLIDPARAHGC